MKLFNTFTRTVEEYMPPPPGKITFYQCGPTVYWVQHIGNLRAMTWADLIHRSMKFLGYQVVMARNYTDVGHLTSDEDEGEDKMEKGAKREGLTPQQIADKYIDIFESDTASLNILEPSFKPRATQYIQQMIQMVQILLDNKHAYRTEYAIYFDVSTYDAYNKLNHQKIEENKKGMGKGTADDPEKKHFADFALWFFKKGAHKNALQTWDSPWGIGFPGWHIECSVMSKELLGDTIDVHMGGVEHISVHHTNEIAQSESANGKPFVRYWLHNEHLNVDNAKMAKSQGTGFTLQQIIDKGYYPLELRYFFLQAHYRSKQNFTWEAMNAAREGYKRMKEAVINFKSQIPENDLSQPDGEGGEYKQKFINYISNDFQIPQALALTWELIKSSLTARTKLRLVEQFDSVLGLKLMDSLTDVIPPEIIALAEQRKNAKMSKDYVLSDSLRKQIETKGYSVEDIKEGYKIKIKR